jgi:Cys-tRNA synthase (O-phospho-L-seryl-tRNA:Cys-tRNA synthase)
MGLFDFLKKKENNKFEHKNVSSQESVDDFTKDMISSADFFLKTSSERFKGLDFSVKSLEVVESALDEASEFYEDMNQEQRHNLIKTIGSYIFEVARRKYGGKYFWYDQLTQPILVTGQPDFEVSILAFEKVKGRLENGKEDNIPFYFAGYEERVNNKQSGLIV